MKHPFLAVVDDDPQTVDVIRAALATIGFASRGFEHGRAFLDQFHPATSGPILGINMPVMNGYEVLTEMNRLGIVLPVITISAHTPEPQIQKLLRSGSDFHLVKPFPMAVLLPIVQQII